MNIEFRWLVKKYTSYGPTKTLQFRTENWQSTEYGLQYPYNMNKWENVPEVTEEDKDK